MDDLDQVYHLLDKQTRQRVGLMMRIPVFIKDPAVALEDPVLGVQEIEVRLGHGFGDGPTSSRIAVVDFNADTQQVAAPVVWDADSGWFRVPSDGEWLPDAPKEPPKDRPLSEDEQREYNAYYRPFIEKTVSNQHFHQVNAWAVVQRVLEFYEDPQALGRAVPWGFDGNRLIVVPHAGYGENAFYDRNSKSLQFYYFGDVEKPGYTCLSHDIIAHETGHAVLDGIRPLYNQLLLRADLRLPRVHRRPDRHPAGSVQQRHPPFPGRERLGETCAAAGVLADLARQFGEEVEGRPYLRSAINELTMEQVERSSEPTHRVAGADRRHVRHPDRNRQKTHGEERADERAMGSMRTPGDCCTWP